MKRRLSSNLHKPLCCRLRNYTPFLLGLALLLGVLRVNTPSFAASADWPAPVPIRTCADEPCATIAMGKVIYRVPKSYLPGSDIPPDRQGAHPAIWLNLLLPDFRPAGDDRKEFDRIGWHNQLRGLFEHGDTPLDPEAWAKELLRVGHISETDFTTENDCKVYRGDMNGISELHVCKLPDRTFVLECNNNTLYVRSPSCEVRDKMTDSNLFDYSYSYLYHNNAIAIDNEIRRTISTFLSDTSEHNKQ